MAHGSNSSGNGNDVLDTQQVVAKTFADSLKTLNNHQYKPGEDTGIFGLDSGFLKVVNTAYTSLAKQVNDWIAPRVYEKVIAFGPSIKRITGIPLEGKQLNQTAAGVTLAVNLGMMLGPGAAELYHTVRGQFDAKDELRRRLAPTLDAVYGSHAMGTLNRIQVDDNGKIKGNSVIVAHRRRMHKENHTTNMGIFWANISQHLLNIAAQSINVHAMVTGTHRDELFKQRHEALTAEYEADIQAKLSKGRPNLDTKSDQFKSLVSQKVRERIEKENLNGNLAFYGIGGATLAQFADAMKSSGKRKLEATRQPYSALEMILALEEQVQNNPGGANRFALPGRKGGELPLDKYVAEIFKQHLKEMADFDPRYVELRGALNSDLDAVSKVIAEQIQAGDLNPQMLVRLVGEGMVVKNKGHGLAGVDEVQELLEKYASKSQSFAVTDPKKYVAERNFTIEHVKEDLKTLEGEERIHYAATLPDQVLRMAGMSDSDIHTVQEQRARTAHDVFLMQETLGVDAQPDEELREAGLGSTQINRLHKDAELIREGGEKAVRKLKSGPTNADGLEHIVNDFVTPIIAGDKQYLGKLLATGRDALENPRAQQAANDKDYGDEISHAERLAARRSHGHGHSQSFE